MTLWCFLCLFLICFLSPLSCSLGGIPTYQQTLDSYYTHTTIQEVGEVLRMSKMEVVIAKATCEKRVQAADAATGLSRKKQSREDDSSQKSGVKISSF
jgi:hypothetical protein